MSSVIVTCEDNLGKITLNNPEIHNALKKNDIEIIRSALSNFKYQKVGAILITGKGNSFCSGLYLDEFDYKSWSKNPITQICEDIENCQPPVICALNGGAYGGAVEIALSCDFRIANDHLSLMVPASDLGIHYEPMGLKRALNILGPSISRRLFLLGERISFEDILRTDFVDFWVAEDETVMGEGEKIANSLSSKAPLAVAGMKRTIIEILNGSLEIKSAKKRINECFKSLDHQEALSARRERRPAKFKGG